MNYRLRQKALGDSSSGGPQHLRADSFDCCPESYEIVVYCLTGPLCPNTKGKYGLKIMSHNVKTFLRTCVPGKDSDQLAHLNSLIRIFTGHILDSQGCKASTCIQQRL